MGFGTAKLHRTFFFKFHCLAVACVGPNGARPLHNHHSTRTQPAPLNKVRASATHTHAHTPTSTPPTHTTRLRASYPTECKHLRTTTAHEAVTTPHHKHVQTRTHHHANTRASTHSHVRTRTHACDRQCAATEELPEHVIANSCRKAAPPTYAPYNATIFPPPLLHFPHAARHDSLLSHKPPCAFHCGRKPFGLGPTLR